MKAAETPMMKQYLEAKSAHPDRVVLFRMGDFYETFFEDAELVAAELELTLTSRNKKDGEEAIPMAGVPYHAAKGYIRRLLERGHSVAICEQLEDPSSAKGIVRRGVVRVITPGTQLDEEGLEADRNHFLASVLEGAIEADAPWLIVFLDVSTGELRATEVQTEAALRAEMRRVGPVEVLTPPECLRAVQEMMAGQAAVVVQRPADHLDLEALYSGQRASDIAVDERSQRALTLTPSQLRERIGPLESAGFRDPAALGAALALLFHYLLDTQGGVPAILSSPQWYRSDAFVSLDPATTDNLEIFETLRGGKRKGSLIDVLDKTVTSAGARRLRTWLAYPLLDSATILVRQRAIAELSAHPTLRPALRKLLRGTADIQRLCARLAAGQGSPRDLATLRHALERVPKVRSLLQEAASDALLALHAALDPCTEVATDIAATLVDEPPLTLQEGGLVRQGVDPDLDRLLELTTNGKSWLVRYEAEQRKTTGISSLKVRYNRVFGYYIEVTRAQLESVPGDYIRKQTLANAERYFTPELKEFEEEILHAEERRNALEVRLFEALRGRVSQHLQRLRETASWLAELDALLSMGEVAATHGWVAPEFTSEVCVWIDEGRHPVVEEALEGGRFVPNDVHLEESARMQLITGPNMSGKSTVIRQTALLVLMAQTGSFVPAKSMRLGVVDQIFSRVGASDNLARGQSTFMVEMAETAHILRSATRRSLVILDEIGRGTSTWDGLAIAWSVAEHLHDQVACLTLFATHYHELTSLRQTCPAVRNLSVAVREWQGEIVFLHRLVEGAAHRSYGLEVARLAGVPEPVLRRGREILDDLEARALRDRAPAREEATQSGQLSLFGDPAPDPAVMAFLDALQHVDVERTTPLDALHRLTALREEARLHRDRLTQGTSA